jgi:hypothetical protein
VTFPYICLYYIPNCLFYSITLPSPLFLIPHLVVISAGLNVPYSYLDTFVKLKKIMLRKRKQMKSTYILNSSFHIKPFTHMHSFSSISTHT